MSARAESVRRQHSQKKRHLSVVERRLRSKPSTRSTARRKAAAIAASALLCGAIVVGVLLERVLLAQSAFELAKVRKQMAVQEAKHEELLLEAAHLDSAARVERYARTNLDMVDPPPGTVEYVVADVRVGEPIAKGTVQEGSEPARASGGLRSAASVGASP
ncbi:MAG: hypothetical protein ACRDJJ_04380 [Actinomycetota bacterium]